MPLLSRRVSCAAMPASAPAGDECVRDANVWTEWGYNWWALGWQRYNDGGTTGQQPP